ncbi:zinc finger protein 644-like isoform X2 [Penaeus japonicus]|nr:zinc finger protein 644-like isoform X2 [Penaeus japonicus]
MYDHYDHMKLPQDATATLKLETVVPPETLSSTDSLTTVTLSGGEGLVAPALANNSHTATNALTTTSFSGGVRLTAPSLSTNGNLSITSLTSAGATSTIPTTSTPTDNFARSTITNSDAITAATIPAVDSNSHNQVSQMNMNQIVTTSGDGVIDGNLVTSSAIDAVVTTMVAPSDCSNVASSCRKVPQVIVKLLSDDSLSLDMVRIIAEQETDNTSHNAHGFNMLTRSGTLVHTKLSENSIINAVAPNQYRQTEVIRPSIKDEGEVNPECSVVWTCAYCSLAFSSSEAVGQHQEKDCTENPNNVVFTTTTSQSTVDALMSPLRESEDPSYNLKLERDSQSGNGMKDVHDSQKVQVKNIETPDCETTWNCAVCGSEFTDPKELNQHHMTHSVQELSSALFKFTTPHQKAKKSTRAKSPVYIKTVFRSSMQTDSAKCRWNKDITDSKMEEEMADNPGDTPPQTPPLEVTVKKRKRKPGPKAKPREKSEKRKYVRKLGSDGKPIRQREYKIPPAGHGSRDPHTCYICSKVLSSRGNLAKHLVLHNLDKPWVCNLCGIGFNAKRDHKHHYLQHHTNERPNICKVCGKGYVDSRYLLEHMVFHRQERSHSCDVCGKTFRTAKCVARHKKRHEKEKHYTCEICCKSFAVKGDLTSHIRKVHNSDKKSSAKQQKEHQLQQQASQQHIDHGSHHVKSKDITEFLLPSGTPAHILPDQLLPTDLESASLSGSVTTKDGIFISSDPLAIPALIPIRGTGENGVNCSYGVALTTPGGGPGVTPTVGDHATYIMINNPDEEVASNAVPSTHGLNIMYTADPAQAPSQQVGEVDGTSLDQIEHLSSSVGPSLVSSNGQLHHRLSNQGQIDQGQDGQTIITEENVLEESHRQELKFSTTSGESGSEMRADVTHNPSTAPSPSDPGPGFHLELLSQTIQLELQRSQTSTGFIG